MAKKVTNESIKVGLQYKLISQDICCDQKSLKVGMVGQCVAHDEGNAWTYIIFPDQDHSLYTTQLRVDELGPYACIYLEDLEELVDQTYIDYKTGERIRS